MTTTNYTIGIGNDDKISSKVLKPPGGESHDIFGTGSYRAEAVPHRNTNHLQSSVFGDAPAAGQAPVSTPGRKHGNHGGGASSIVFGAGVNEEDELTPRKIKDYQKSNVFGEQNEPSYLNGNTGIRRYNASAGLGAGNPITGEGYVSVAAANGNGEQAKENGQNNSGVRGRNPPGGHSTRLW